ncbi:MAG: transposase [Oscillospiraceae bacterium]|nr:transposase [Oscillospiraceae bacterium]
MIQAYKNGMTRSHRGSTVRPFSLLKLHAIVDGLGNPVEFMLSAGNVHDSVHAVKLLERAARPCADRAMVMKPGRFQAVSPISSYFTEHLSPSGFPLHKRASF